MGQFHQPFMNSFLTNKIELVLTTTLGTQHLWPLLTGGRCLGVDFCYEDSNWYSEMVVSVDRWPFVGVGR
jgi:hypothetical protein